MSKPLGFNLRGICSSRIQHKYLQSTESCARFQSDRWRNFDLGYGSDFILSLPSRDKKKRHIPANIYLFKINNKSTRKRCEICSKLTIKTLERRQRRQMLVGILACNPLHPTGLFLHPLKTSENQRFFWCFQGLQKKIRGMNWIHHTLYSFLYSRDFI